MKKSLAIFFACLIAVSISLSSDAQFMKNLKREKFGKTILQSLQIQLATGANGVEKIIVLLKEMRQSNVDEQKKSTEDNNDFQKAKRDYQAVLNERITFYKKAIKNDQDTLKVNSEAIKHQQQIIVDQSAILISQKAKLEANLEAQSTENKRYERQFNELSAQITGLAQAKLSISQLQSGQKGSSFVQINSAIQNIQFQHPKYQSMLNVLAQLMNPEIISNPKLVKTILDIITKLQSQLRKELNILNNAHKIKINDLQLLQSRIQYAIEEATQRHSAAEVKVAKLELDNVNAAQRIKSNQQRVSESQAELEDAKTSAANAQKTFEIETRRRSDELAIIDNIIRILQNEISDDVKAVFNSL